MMSFVIEFRVECVQFFSIAIFSWQVIKKKLIIIAWILSEGKGLVATNYLTTD